MCQIVGKSIFTEMNIRKLELFNKFNLLSICRK